MGINDSSVIFSGNQIKIREQVETIHLQFNEPAIAERYIEGDDLKEYSLPALISREIKIVELPIIGIDYSKIPTVNTKFRYLTQGFKREKRATCNAIFEKEYF